MKKKMGSRIDMPTHTLHPIRVSAKALIIHDGRLLCNHHRDHEGDWYSLPGGGQEYGETIHEALRRELLEEVNAEVVIGPLRFVRDYIGEHHEFAARDRNTHQIELIFECSLIGPYTPTLGSQPDPSQSGVRWLPIATLDRYRLFPKALIPLIMGSETSVVYLGDVN